MLSLSFNIIYSIYCRKYLLKTKNHFGCVSCDEIDTGINIQKANEISAKTIKYEPKFAQDGNKHISEDPREKLFADFSDSDSNSR